MKCTIFNYVYYFLSIIVFALFFVLGFDFANFIIPFSVFYGLSIVFYFVTSLISKIRGKYELIVDISIVVVFFIEWIGLVGAYLTLMPYSLSIIGLFLLGGALHLASFTIRLVKYLRAIVK